MGRKRNDDGEVNLDSLMDALTNVVAVLILVLMLVQIDVVKTVVQLQEDLEPATDEMIVEKTKRIEELEKKLKELDQQKDEEPPSPEELIEKKELIAKLQKELEAKKISSEVLAKLITDEKKAREKRDKEAAETEALQAEIERLLIAIDDTPILDDPPPEVVTIPNSRPIPKNANTYYAICRKDGVHFIDPFTPEESFMKEFKKYRTKWVVERIERNGERIKLYDREKIEAHFKNFSLDNSRGQKVQLITNKHNPRLYLRTNCAEGTKFADLSKAKNRFNQICKTVARDKDNILIFRVHPDGMSTYVKARQIADKNKVPAGWEMNASTVFQTHIKEIEVKAEPRPAQPKPTTPPKPAKPAPPKISTKLD